MTTRRWTLALGVLVLALSCTRELRAQLNLRITTTALPRGVMGIPYSSTVMATGGIGAYTWAATGLPPGYAINPSSGTITGTTNQTGDFTMVRVTVRDILSNVDNVTFTLSVYVPLSISNATLPPGMVGAAYSQSLTPAGGAPPYTWSVPPGTLPAGLTLSAAGVISGTPTTAGTSNFEVRVDDGSMQTASRPLSITISPATLSISTTSLASGTVGTPYSQTLTATGGTPPFGWQLQAGSGSLPQGLTISPMGVISGTPTTAGNFNFTVRVDDGMQTAFKPLSIMVSPALLSVTTDSLPSGTVGIAYSQTLSATGGTLPYSWSVPPGSLPTGLTLSPAGLISGTPTTARIFNFTVTVADSGSQTAPKALVITINPPPLSITTTSLPSGTVGVEYSQSLGATGGTPPYAWSVSGSFPQGLTLAQAGLISGTPSAAGNFSFTVRVADSGSQSRTQDLSITINPPPLSITTTSLSSGTVGVDYSQSLAASGGAPPYRWSVQPGSSLPQGLTLSSEGTISGKPAAAGTSNFRVRVEDSASQSVISDVFSLMISPPVLSITTESLPVGVVGVGYSPQTLTAIGGTPPYTWSVPSGTLPQGLTLSGNMISGIPTTAGTSSFTVRVVDSGSQVASRILSIMIAPAQLSITTPSPLPSGTLGTPYSQTLAATGGTSPYGWSVSLGSFPPGLTLSPAGVISGIPTTVGTSNVTVRVADGSQTAFKDFSISVNSVTYTFSLANVPATMNPAQQMAIGVSISEAQSIPLQGTLALSFASNAVVPIDDAAVRFSNGNRTASFTIAANTTAAVFQPGLLLMTGTVSGTIMLRADIQNGPTAASVGSVTIAQTVPQLTNITAARTSDGIRVQITGYSPERKISGAEFGFDVRTGNGTQRVTLTRNVEIDFDAWYRNAGSSPYGSSFLFDQSFAVQGDASAIQSVAIKLTNGVGSASSTSVPIAAN